MKYLTGRQVPVARVKSIAKAEGFTLFPTAKTPLLETVDKEKYPEHLSLIADKFNDERLKELFTLPIEQLIDAQAMNDSIHDFVSRSLSPKFEKRLSFLLTCPVIYKCDVAAIFVAALNHRLNLSEERSAGIHLALHEAIVNGLIHGNLEISSEYRQSARLFMEYGRILAERLNDPAYARKSIYISAQWNESKLEIKIRDEGAGYAIKNAFYRRSLSNPKSKTGRGLLFIAGIADSCTIDDYGREINLTFGLKEDYTKAENAYIQEQPEENKHTYARPSVSECRVLIIEDNLSNQTMLYRLLNVIGINMVECATDGIEGLKKVETFKPDLIILDITMPRMNGYDVLHHLKSSPATQNIPVLIETASDTREARDKTFRTGATDFITKPINPLEFFSRIKVHLENRLLIKHLEKQLEQIEEELISAQKMQRTLLPSDQMLENIRARYGIDFAHHFEPSSRLGGDFWELIPLSENKLAVYICDFSGHGMSAALNTFRLHALITQMDHLNIEIPASAMAMMNSQLLTLLPRGQFATFFLAVIDFAKNILTYSAAGVPKPLMIVDGKPRLINADGMPLGISKQAQYHNLQVPFPKGSQLLLYSDALTESPNAAGERMGEEKFTQMAMRHLNKPTSKEAVTSLMKEFFEYAPPPPPDDVTVVYLKRDA